MALDPDGWLAKQLELAAEELIKWPEWKKAELIREINDAKALDEEDTRLKEAELWD